MTAWRLASWPSKWRWRPENGMKSIFFFSVWRGSAAALAPAGRDACARFHQRVTARVCAEAGRDPGRRSNFHRCALRICAARTLRAHGVLPRRVMLRLWTLPCCVRLRTCAWTNVGAAPGPGTGVFFHLSGTCCLRHQDVVSICVAEHRAGISLSCFAALIAHAPRAKIIFGRRGIMLDGRIKPGADRGGTRFKITRLISCVTHNAAARRKTRITRCALPRLPRVSRSNSSGLDLRRRARNIIARDRRQLSGMRAAPNRQRFMVHRTSARVAIATACRTKRHHLLAPQAYQKTASGEDGGGQT